MERFIEQLTTTTQLQQHCMCSHEEQEIYIPLGYPTSPSPTHHTPHPHAFPQELTEPEDIRTRLLKYNPSLAKHFSQTEVPLSAYHTPVRGRHIARTTQSNKKSPSTQPGPITLTPLIQDDRKDASISKVNQYIHSLKDTREMPDSKFRKYFKKPCFCTYGAYNTKMENGGLIYGEYMKSHNVSPHKHGNHPATYETYESALLHANRQIINQQDNTTQILKEIERSQRLKQNTRQEMREDTRHNKTANPSQHKSTGRMNVLVGESRSVLSKEEVRKEDKHIEQHQHKNFVDKVKYEYPDHYLVPAGDKSQRGVNTTKGEGVRKGVQKSVKSFTSLGVNKKVVSKVPLQSKQGQGKLIERKEAEEPVTSFRIVQLSHAGTQTLYPRQESVNPELSKAKSSDHISNPSRNISSSNNNPHNKSQTKSILKQSSSPPRPHPHPPIRPPNPYPLSNDQPQPLSATPIYSYQQQHMSPPYTYCLHKHCQETLSDKKIAIQRGTQEQEVGDRLIAVAKRAKMYKNYLPGGDSSQDSPPTDNNVKGKKGYYELPRSRMNPQNYSCQQWEEMKEIPYAGKAGHYKLN